MQNTRNTFESTEQAYQLLSRGLQERYQQEFLLIGNGRIVNVPYHDEPFVYYADFAPVAETTQVFSAGIDIDGGITDTFGQYFFKKKVESCCLKQLSPFAFIDTVTAELDPTETGRIWTAQDPVEAYMGTGGSPFDPYVLVTIYLSDRYSSEEQAAQVKQCLDSLYDVGFGVYVKVFTEKYQSKTIYSRKFAVGTEPEFRHDVDIYLDEIETNKYFMDDEAGRLPEHFEQN